MDNGMGASAPPPPPGPGESPAPVSAPPAAPPPTSAPQYVPPAAPVAYPPTAAARIAGADNATLFAVAGGALGIALITMCVPCLGTLAVPVCALIFGFMGLKSERKGLAIAGIVCAALWMLGILAYILIYGATLLTLIQNR